MLEIEKTIKSYKAFTHNRGFTLVELLCVILILGIIGAVIVPKFKDSTMNAKISLLKSHLASIRRTLEVYTAYHNGEYPNAIDPNTFVNQLARYTNINQQVSAVKTREYPYGPYIKHTFPKNPFARKKENADRVYIVTANDPLGVFKIDPNKGGWLYKTNTGEFVPNIYVNEPSLLRENLEISGIFSNASNTSNESP